jgi:glycosyltransferase involved in cell wall biosynthesis
MLILHRAMGTYRNKVTRYIALNEFCRDKFVQAGLPADRLVVKPNFVESVVPGRMQRERFLFVGRLSTEKGIATLPEAMQQIPSAKLRVAGDGPEAALLEGVEGVSRLGSLAGDAVREEMTRAMALVVPSIWYENFPRTIVEAFACGLPVIASRIGALAEIVEEGKTGLLFEPGNPRDLAEKMTWALDNPAEMRRMGDNARSIYEEKYTPERNYEQLMAIYKEAIAAKQREAAHA